MKSIRLSHNSVLLNGRIVHFPKGSDPRAVCAALAKHNPPAEKGAPATKKAPCSKGSGMPDHPHEGIAHAVAWRLANPTNRAFLAKEVKRARGSNGRKTIVKNDGQLRGFAPRPLSAHDMQEVRGCVSLVLAELGHPEKIDFAAWKKIFSAARRTLGMKRKVNRESLLDSLDTVDFHSELAMDSALIASLAEDREEADRAEQAKRDRVAQGARHLLALLRAARRGASRRAKANFRISLRYLRRATRAALGQGHAHELTRTAAYEQNRAFREYLGEGEAQAARETAAAQAVWLDAETARLMYAVAE